MTFLMTLLLFISSADNSIASVLGSAMSYDLCPEPSGVRMEEEESFGEASAIAAPMPSTFGKQSDSRVRNTQGNMFRRVCTELPTVRLPPATAAAQRAYRRQKSLKGRGASRSMRRSGSFVLFLSAPLCSSGDFCCSSERPRRSRRHSPPHRSSSSPSSRPARHHVVGSLVVVSVSLARRPTTDDDDFANRRFLQQGGGAGAVRPQRALAGRPVARARHAKHGLVQRRRAQVHAAALLRRA